MPAEVAWPRLPVNHQERKDGSGEHPARNKAVSDVGGREDVSGGRRRALVWLATGALLSSTGPVMGLSVAREPLPAWPGWEAFKKAQIQADGRVIDYITKDLRSTSESQAYAMFFALVANDKLMFASVWHWTRHNLMSGSAPITLPGWLWGRSASGGYRLLDGNSASDADLWMAYALLEAGRLWRREDYSAAGHALLQLIQVHEATRIPGLGPMLLPGRLGFAGTGWWKLNPSYLPIQVLRRCALELPPSSPWAVYPHQALRLIQLSAVQGFVADWVRWNGSSMQRDVTASWDAIRTYLWAGMLADEDALRAPLLSALHGPLDQLRNGQRMPEKIHLESGLQEGREPRGYAGALLPYLAVQGQNQLLASQQQQIPPVAQYATTGLPYFERMLILFGEGWLQHRFRFGPQGHLMPSWA